MPQQSPALARRDLPRRLAASFGCLLGATGVAAAALAAHLGPDLLGPRRLAILHDAVQMQLWHALALLGAAALLPRGTRLGHAALAGIAAGILLFLAGLYAIVAFDRSLGPVAPIGGTLLILSWLLLAPALWRELTPPGATGPR